MKRRFSLFLAILMLVSVFSPLGLGFEGNEIRFSTNVVEAAEDDAQLNEATPKEEVNDASEEVTPDVDNGTLSTEDKDVQPEVDLKDQNIILTNDILTIGKDVTERNFTWYANTKEKGKFEFAKLNAEKDFKDATVIDATVIEETNKDGFSSNSVTLEGLKPDTEYMYRFSNGDTVSEVKTFKTGKTGDFSFFAAGDPQIGAGFEDEDEKGWDKTLKLLPELDPSASFLLSLGDQVNISDNERQYDAYINRDGFDGLTLAPIIGNHDSGNHAYTEHFKVPNVQDEGTTNAGSNYYYVYNNTLFICLNTNKADFAEHKATIEKAIAENPNVKWRVVTFHQPPYTVATHALDKDVLNIRANLVPILKENKIDLVLNGHDHVYTRTHVMDGTKPIIEWKDGENKEAPSEYVNPKGIIYVTTNSASGSKFYSIKNEDFEYSAVKNQEKVPNISNVKVTDNSIEVTTYRTSDKSIVDSFKIVKEDKKENQDKPVIPTPVEPEKDNKDDKEESSSNVRRHRSHSHTKTYPVYTSKSSNFTKEDALKKGEEIANKNLAKNSGKATDIDGHWAKDSINYALENNLIDLIGNEFKPNKNATRYNVVKALGRFKKIDVEKYKGKSLKDVEANSEESAYVNWAIENGIIVGYEDNTFGVDREITREEIARILNLFAEKFDIKVKNLEAPKFKDQNKISDWASKDVKEATEKGLLVGRDDGTFGPKDNLTRAEVAQMIVNMIK